MADEPQKNGMKIGLVNNAWRGTGIGRYVFDLFLQLEKDGRNIDMLFLRTKREFGYQNPKIFNINAPIKNSTIANYVYFPSKIPKGYEIYHISNETIAKCVKGRQRSVVTCAALLPFISNGNGLLKNFIERRQLSFLKQANGIISLSKSLKRQITERLDIDPKLIDVVYPGINHNTFKPRDKVSARKKFNLPLDKKIVLHVGTEEPRKNVNTYLQALPMIIKDVPNLLFVRVGWQSPSNKKIIKENGLDNYVRYMDIPTSQVHEIYAAADLFVFPSIYEGLSLPPLEAMASGIPVIAANADANLEGIGDGGIIIDKYDVSTFAQWTVKILTDEKMALSLQKRAVDFSSRFTWEHAADETWKVYEKVMQENPR